MYQENLGLIRVIGVENGVRDMDVYLQDAYLALGDACRLYNWKTPFTACLRVHLKKAIFEHTYRYGYPVRVNYKNCKSVGYAGYIGDVVQLDSGFDTVEDNLMYAEICQQLTKLPDMDREIMQMRYVDNKTLAEIARRFSVSTVTIYKHINKSIRIIREEID